MDQKGRRSTNFPGHPSSADPGHQCSWLSGLQTWAELQPWLSWVSSLLAYVVIWADSYNKSPFMYIISPIGYVSLDNPD